MPLVVVKMVTLLFTSLFVLALLAVAIYFWQKPAPSDYPKALPPPPGRALFENGTPSAIAEAAADAETQAKAEAQRLRSDLLGRANAGDKASLNEVFLKHPSLYDEVLDCLVSSADSQPKLLSLMSYLTRNKLRVNKGAAEKFIKSAAGNLDRGTTAKMLHVAALSDDATVYQEAVEAALQVWRAGTIPGLSAQEFSTILEGEFWILSSSTRSSGAGFVLKRALAGARRELDTARRD